jgi:hypothetical protein
MGKRIDKDLAIDANVLKKIKGLSLCSRHYLREDCVQGCGYSHKYPRPLSIEEYDVVWYLARAGLCQNLTRNADCNDERCIYGHRHK